MSYTDKHKMLLQAFIQEGIIGEDVVKELIIKLFNDDNISLIVNQVNKELQPLDMLIKKAQCELTGQLYWVLMSTVLDETTKLQDEFTKPQLALLRNIFTEIIMANNGNIPSTICLNLCILPDVQLSKAQVEDFLKSIVERKWLSYKEGYYYMGVRSITELMPYFRATYENNLNTCFLCKQVIFYGTKCDHCDSMLHLYCIKRFVTARGVIKCPNCNQSLSNLDLTEITTSSELIEKRHSLRTRTSNQGQE